MSLDFRLLIATLLLCFVVADVDRICPKVSRAACCTVDWDPECVPKNCFKWVLTHCPERRSAFGRKFHDKRQGDIRRAPVREDLGKCGTAERNYQPCTSKRIANKLFRSCCELYVPDECHFMCEYETDQSKTRKMLIDLVRQKKCSIKYLSSILYCASQNRDNRKCCSDLDLNAPQLQVGSRCLRMCDPSGTSIEKITKDDVTCLYNWNVIMYCHHAGIREM
ncbi:unnamed protein product, partial [Mesorhabditis belari]|uniref:Domain of unknown function DB domain-containing protein n=1 Tax=Mesorhabditis belari TaxID=2138241 RepID=A0AAF3F381_9BILA